MLRLGILDVCNISRLCHEMLQLLMFIGTELLESNYLIVFDDVRRNLFQVGIDNGIMVPILPVQHGGVTGIAYDPVNGYVYWTDKLQHWIARYSLVNRSRTTTIVKQFDCKLL